MSEDINIGAITEALNDKVDLSSAWSTPTTTSDALTPGASGSYYTAPADGYFELRATAPAAGRYLELISSKMDSLVQSGGANLDLAVFIPVARGQTVWLYYSTNTPSTFRFVYAQKTN